ncbi:MAG: enolase C-terminal domain-like protein [Elusimicrobiota bacterium]
MTRNRYRLVSAGIHPVRWFLRRPFVTALGSKDATENVLVRLKLSGGAAGWGEASSSLAMAFQTAPKMAAALRRLFAAFRGRDVRDIELLAREIWRREGAWPAAAAAFETALYDAFARAHGIPFSYLWGGARRSLTTLITIPAASPEDVFDLARAAARRGFRALKLKINGRDASGSDARRLRSARRAAPRARLLLDANQSYEPEALSRLLSGARRDGIEAALVEEPFTKRDWAALARYRRSAPPRAPVLLDESVQTPRDARRGRLLAEGVNVKLAKSGLVLGKEIVDAFRAPGRDSSAAPGAILMIGCMAESPLGLSAAVHWACGLGVFDFADLDSDLLLQPTAVRPGYRRRGPEVVLPKNLPAGLGVEWPA